VVGEGNQFDQRTGTLALRAVIGKPLLPLQSVQDVLLNQRVVAWDARFDNIELLDQLVQVEKQVLQGLVDGLVG